MVMIEKILMKLKKNIKNKFLSSLKLIFTSFSFKMKIFKNWIYSTIINDASLNMKNCNSVKFG
jgi:hypothetical protein